jgi:PKD repeat protein
MFLKRTYHVALCLFAFCWPAAHAAPTAETSHMFVPPKPAPAKPSPWDPILQAFSNQAALAPLKLSTPNTNPVAVQPIYVTASWDKRVTGATYLFRWGDTQSPTNPSSLPEQDHVYPTAGTFTVLVQAKGTFNGQIVTSSRRLPITVAPAPVVTSTSSTTALHPLPPPALKLHANPDSVVQDHPIQFSVSIDPPAKVERFHFYFGDTDTFGPSPIIHKYALPGTYRAYVTTELGSGAVSQSPAITILVRPAAVLPVVTLVGPTATQHAGVELSVSANLFPQESPVRFNFNWGDGSPPFMTDDETLGTASHTYQSAGTYLVTATALILRDGNMPAITSEPLPVVVTSSSSFLVWILAGLAVLAGGSFLLWPKVIAVYSSTRWDAPKFVDSEPTHLTVRFQPGQRPAQYSIRTLK